MPKNSGSASFDENWDDDDFYGRMLSGIASSDYDMPHIAMSEMLAEPTKKDREAMNKNRVRQVQRSSGKSFSPKPPRRVQGR